MQELGTSVRSDSKTASKHEMKTKPIGLQKFFSVASKGSTSTETCTKTNNSLKQNEVEIVDVAKQTMKDGNKKKPVFRSFFKSGEKQTSSNDLALQVTAGNVSNESCASSVRENVACGMHTGGTSLDVVKDCDPSESSFRTPLTVGETSSKSELKQASRDVENSSNANSISTDQPSICDKFFASRTELPNKGFTAEDFVLCNKCGKRILIWDLPEHNDFHFAQDLSHDLNSSASSSNSPMPKAKSPPRKKTKLASSSIENFFKSK